MHWQVELLATGQPAAWLPKEYLPEGRKTQAPPDANGSDTSSVSGSGSKMWEDNFRALHAEVLRIAHRYPGLIREINSTLEKMESPDLWN